MSQRGLRLLRAAWQEAKEDHLGAGLIRHGDSVIIMNEAGKGDSFSRRVEPRDIVPLLPLVAEGLSFILPARRKSVLFKATVCLLLSVRVPKAWCKSFLRERALAHAET